MHSYSQAHRFTPEKQKDTGAQGDILEDELEGHRSDSEELDSVSEGNNTTEEHAPEHGRSLDEIVAFLEANSGITSTADADSSDAGPSTPPAMLSKAPNVSVNRAIDGIMRYTPRRVDTSEGVFDPVNTDTTDVETGSGSDQDRRQRLAYEKKGSQMLRLYFESLGLRSGADILRWYVQNPGQMPMRCHRVYSVGSGWFPVDLLKAGKWPEMGRVSFDEAHTLRNQDSVYYIAARLVPAREMPLVTGTPQFNGTHDIHAYASLFAARAGLDGYFEVDTGPECSAIINSVKSSEDVIRRGYVKIRHRAKDTSFITQLHQWADKDLARRRWWCLLRGYHTTIGWKKKTTAAGVFLSSFISLRRMKTALRIGGQNIYPGASLPECTVRTVELSFRPEDKNLLTLQHLASAAVKFMYTSLDFTDQNDRSTSAQTKAQRIRRRRLLREIKDALNIREGREGPIAMALHRVLTLISFDMRNYRLLFDKKVYDSDPLVRLSDEEVKKLNGISQNGQPLGKNPEPAGGGKTAPAAKICLGSDDVKKLVRLDKFRGVFWQYVLCAPPGSARSPNQTRQTAPYICLDL